MRETRRLQVWNLASSAANTRMEWPHLGRPWRAPVLERAASLLFAAPIGAVASDWLRQEMQANPVNTW
jgi:hypothetical protein